MIKQIRMIVCALLVVFTFGTYSEAAGITQYQKLISSMYWTSQNIDGDKLVMTTEEVDAFNQDIRAESRTVYDLTSYPEIVKGSKISSYLNDYIDLTSALYREGKVVSDNYKENLRLQINSLSLPKEVKVRYGVTIKRANLRNLPTGEGLFSSDGDRDFDVLQETVLDPGEAVAILHTSTNGYFYYVQAYNYRGWLSKFDIAETNRETWLSYVEPQKFLVVTGKSYTLKTNSQAMLFQQGARLKFNDKSDEKYIVQVPKRTQEGKLQELKIKVSTGIDLHEGYLPYTTNNILRSAFKFYGEDYGWGGLKNSVDCSSLISNVYRTVGVFLPRDADEQETSVGIHQVMSNKNSKERTSIITALSPGSTLHMDGHVMLYLGSSNGVPYAIHSLGSHYTGGKRNSTMKVVVSDLNLQKASGNTYLNELRTCVTFR